METIQQEIKTHLLHGEDNEARAHLNGMLEVIIKQGEEGELNVADYVDELDAVLRQAREYRHLFNT